MRFVYFVGTAGSGKSTLVGAYSTWLTEHGIDNVTVNLDPGADMLPYEPDVDIREWVSLAEVMDEYDLGPNGAQIVAADLMALNINKLKDELDEIHTKYVLLDTPGQLELFAFRGSSGSIVDALGKEKSAVVYLSDPLLCKSSNGYISNMVLSSLVQFRLQLPVINVITKEDVITPEERDMLICWHNDSNTLYEDLMDNDANPQTVVGLELFKALENVGTFGDIFSLSSKKGEGMENIYNMTQQLFFGGEDPDTSE